MKVANWFLTLLLFISPVAAARNMRCDTLHTVVNFHTGHSAIDPDYMDNGSRLRQYSDRLAMIHSDSSSVIHRIHVRGAASPEGSTARNMYLSRQRARSVAKYLAANLSLPDSIFEMQAIGADRDMLDAMVDTSAMPHRDHILAILRDPSIKSGDRSLSDRQFRLIAALDGGQPYRYMAKRYFPEMRNAGITTEIYFVEPFTETLCPDETPSVQQDSTSHTECATPQSDFAAADPVTDSEPGTESHSTHVAFKTNLLYDAALLPNIGMEIALGHKWSIGVGGAYAWWSRKSKHHFYRIRTAEIEGRRWWTRPRSGKGDDCLTGHHLGIYAHILEYDLEFGGTGRQSDGLNYGAGISYGYSLPVSRAICIDFSIGIGWLGGKYKKYRPVDNCYVWQSTVSQNWFGPTKAEISLVYKLGKKGGRR